MWCRMKVERVWEWWVMKYKGRSKAEEEKRNRGLAQELGAV